MKKQLLRHQNSLSFFLRFVPYKLYARQYSKSVFISRHIRCLLKEADVAINND